MKGNWGGKKGGGGRLAAGQKNTSKKNKVVHRLKGSSKEPEKR